jgi:hypothetical protein
MACKRGEKTSEPRLAWSVPCDSPPQIFIRVLPLHPHHLYHYIQRIMVADKGRVLLAYSGELSRSHPAHLGLTDEIRRPRHVVHPRMAH